MSDVENTPPEDGAPSSAPVMPVVDVTPAGVDYRRDGSIVATIVVDSDGATRTYRLRPPFLDELLDLWASADTIAAKYGVDAESRNALLADYRAALADYQKRTEDGDGTAVPPDNPVDAAFQRKIMEANGDWAASVFEALATPAFDGRRAPWFANGGLVTQFVTHWQQIPLAPGVPATTP